MDTNPTPARAARSIADTPATRATAHRPRPARPTRRKALLIDVDGPLNPFGPGFDPRRTPGYRDHQIDGFLVRLNPGVGAALVALAAETGADLVWATMWEHRANEALSSRVGLPDDLPVIEFSAMWDGVGRWRTTKVPAVDAFLDTAGYDRAVWFDDDLFKDAFDWAEDRGGIHLVRVSPDTGITAEHLDAARQYLGSVGPPGGAGSRRSLRPDDASPPAAGPAGGTPRNEAAARLWGCGDLGAAFTGDKRVVPWPNAPRRRGEPQVTPEALRELLAPGPELADVDPRLLFATQTWVVRSHVAYYLGPDWLRTGRTSADRDKPHNRYPLIHVDDAGRMILLAGHHRAAAALIEGRMLRARVRRLPGRRATAVLPTLLAGAGTTLGALATADPATAAALIGAGRTVIVPGLPAAVEVLRQAGLDAAVVADRMSMATTGRCLHAG